MFYGYDGECDGWKVEHKENLIHALSCVLADMGWLGESGFGIVLRGDNAHYPLPNHPYVEVDAFGEGVRIRRIDNISNEERELLIALTDNAYRRVMKHGEWTTPLEVVKRLVVAL